MSKEIPQSPQEVIDTHPMGAWQIAAVVVLAAGKSVGVDELHDYCQQHLRSSKTPYRIEFRDELPHTPTGKLLRREVLADLLG